MLRLSLVGCTATQTGSARLLADYDAWCRSIGGVVKTFPVGINSPAGAAPGIQHICVEAATNKAL